MKPYLTFVHALSPLHAGTGQGVDVIDLPIARERATGLPLLPGSSVKGTLLDAYRAASGAAYDKELFGTAERAGKVQFTDQRLLALPVRSLAGTFAWASSPYLLARFARDALDCDSTFKLSPPQPAAPKGDIPATCALVKEATDLICTVNNTSKIVLEDLDFVQAEEDASDWARYIGEGVFGDHMWQALFARRFCVVHDDVLTFLLLTATEVVARVKLDDTSKTAVDGGLWYEEALPTETILSGLMLAGEADKQQIDAVTGGKTLQFGGKATVGRGLCRVRFGGAQAAQQITQAGLQ
jgi:CRISPR-associated protein Cmr4